MKTPVESGTTKRRVLDEFREPISLTQWSDSRSMREEFGMGAWDREVFEWSSVIPNCIEHSWDSPVDEVDGGTDWLARGKPGTGKSTLANYLVVRLLEANDEKVVWRGSSSRSEWLPLAPWTTLYLPADVEISVRLEPKDPTNQPVDLDVDELTEIVREVRYYRDPVDLNRSLDEGSLHVVYPDPRMRGCQAVYEQSPEKQYDTPPKREALFSEEDPASHWWFAWLLARVEHGPHHWTSLIFDEIGDVCPQSAKKDSYGTYQKVELLKDTWVDMRKFGVSVFAFAHSETDVHQMIRRKLRWRVQMPGTANPTSASDVVGFESIRMNNDMTSRYDVGEALDMYIARERPDKRDMYGRDPLFATRQGRPSRTTIRSWSYQSTQPCLYTTCPHSRERHSCEWTTRGQAGKCPSSRSPHAIRTGAITWLLNATDGDIEYVARRVNAKPATIRRYYDKATVVEEFEERQQRHTDLDINNEPA